MNPVGVVAVVEGLASFLGDIEKINSAVGGIGKSFLSSDIMGIVGGVANAFNNLGREILNVAETALGVMLRDAIEWVIRKLGEIASAAFDAAAEFQLISLRLQGFNLQVLVDSGKEFVDIMTEAKNVTKDQMSWVMKLAATTPYDATDIAFVFSMSEAFGFSATEAKQLTQSTLDFVAAMGLTGVEAKRVIINLGQMAQRGKITTREMNDLARGSLLPLRDVLDRVAKKMGITTGALTKLIMQPGEGVDYKLFMDAFNEMISQEVRFQGAGVRMAHTFQGAWENITQTVRDVIGNFILLPGFLDPIGEKLGTFMDIVGSDKNWDILTNDAAYFGKALGDVITALLNTFFPSAQSIVDGLSQGLDNMGAWMVVHKEDIVGFFKGIGDTIRNDIIPWITEKLIPTLGDIYSWAITNGPVIWGVFASVYDYIMNKIVPWVQDKLIPAFDEIKKWTTDNKPLIDDFFGALAEIVDTVISNLLGIGKEDSREGMEGFLDKLGEVMQWVIDNQDGIAAFVQTWITFWFYAELLKISLGIIWTLIQNILTFGIVALGVPVVQGSSDSYVDPRGGGRGKIPGNSDKGERDTGVSSRVSLPSISNASSSVKHYNLTIVSSANSENLSADFSMLASMS
jgi:tape measure domain-containing protein